jgi:hypothetical protein
MPQTLPIPTSNDESRFVSIYSIRLLFLFRNFFLHIFSFDVGWRHAIFIVFFVVVVD